MIWTQPQSDLLTQYTVQYRMVNSTVWTAIHTPTTAVFIEGLLGGISYQVRVRAVSEIGNGSFTPIVMAKTVGGESATNIHAIPLSRQLPTYTYTFLWVEATYVHIYVQYYNGYPIHIHHYSMIFEYLVHNIVIGVYLSIILQRICL